MVSNTEKILSNTNVIVARQVKKENNTVSVADRGSKSFLVCIAGVFEQASARYIWLPYWISKNEESMERVTKWETSERGEGKEGGILLLLSR